MYDVKFFQFQWPMVSKINSLPNIYKNIMGSGYLSKFFDSKQLCVAFGFENLNFSGLSNLSLR